MKKILVVEDDIAINEMIVIALKKEEYDCVSAYSGTEALLRIQNEEYDLIILDLMLPGMSGERVLAEVKKKNDTPVIVLSAKDTIDVKVSLLSLGASDYMTKPFDLKELIARIQVQLRNTDRIVNQDKKLCFGELSYDESEKQLYVNDNKVTLTAQELKIIQLFLKSPNKIFSKNEIYEYAWDDIYIGEDKTINVHISNLRKKIKKYTEVEYIETLWGLGFKLVKK